MRPLPAPSALVLVLALASTGCGPGASQAPEAARAEAPSALNPMVALHEAGRPVFGLYAPGPGGGRARGGSPPPPVKTPAERAAETLSYGSSDYVFDGSMEGGLDEALPAFTAFVGALRDAGATARTHPLVVKAAKIESPEQVARDVARQLDLGVSGVMFVEVESADEVRAGLAAMRWASEGGTRPDRTGSAPAYWGVDEAEYRRRAGLWPLDPGGELIAWVIVESHEGLARVREIAAVPGIGVLWPGAGTLRGLFTTTDADGRRVLDAEGWEDAIQSVLAACREFDVPCGYPANADDIETRMDQGFEVFVMGWGEGGFATVEKGRARAAVTQAGSDVAPAEVLAGWVALDMPIGYESRLAPGLAAALPGWTADRWGNLVRTVGSGAPERVVACALDAPAYAASAVTDDGYLRVHRIGSGSRHPLWDQGFAAQQVRILTRDGPVAGVIGATNGHFAAQHRGETAILGADDLWVDVGAESAADVAALGIELLDPIVRHLPPWPLASGVAGPAAGARVGCAAVAALAEGAAAGDAPAGTTTFVMSAQQGMGWVGLSAHVARRARTDELILAAPGEAERVREPRPTARMGRMGAVLADAGLQEALFLAPAVMEPGAPMEVVGLDEVDALRADLANALGIDGGGGGTWVAVPAPTPPALPVAVPDLDEVAATLEALVELHGVPGHEWAVRRFVLEALPPWARERAEVDDMGNVWVAVGPDRDTTVFMAHLDEVGYRIEAIEADGTVLLERLGGAVNLAWEGQTALVHFDPPGAPSSWTGEGVDTDPRWKAHSLEAEAPPPLRGVFRSRAEPEGRNPPDPLRAWFGMDEAGLRARGVTEGMGVTSHKEGLRIGRNRFTARALDDRAGTTALIRAVHAIDPEVLPAKVIFAWSVHEEGGLNGASAMAARFGASTRRIYSVDTFVSSDTPLESPHFAFAPLGAGPVLRAIENSSVSPDAERDRVRAAAAAAGIPLQIGLTQGGTDGTTFTFRGAPNQGLSWPGRYSHSPGEVLDLRDLERLGRLVAAVAGAR